MFPVLRVDDTAIRYGLREFARQIPFATSLAMNQAAKRCLPLLRADLHAVFTIRNKWEEMGINFKAATKRDLSVIIGSRHDYMEQQVVGGEKTGRGGGHVAVPLVGAGLPRTTIKSRTPPSKWPKALIGRDDGMFVGTVRGRYGLWRRVERSETDSKDEGKPGKIVRTARREFLWKNRTRAGVKLMFDMPDSVKIKERWPLKDQVEMAWSQTWPEAVAEALAYTLRTAHERGGGIHIAGMRRGTGTNQYATKLTAGR